MDPPEADERSTPAEGNGGQQFPASESWLRGAAGLQRFVDETSDQIRRAIAPLQDAAFPQTEAMQGISKALAPQLQLLQEQLNSAAWVNTYAALARDVDRVLAQVDLTAIADVWRRYHESLPPNWRSLEDEVEIHELGDAAMRTGLALPWVPRAEVLAEIVRADGLDEASTVLEANERQVLDDVDQALGGITREPMKVQAEALGEAMTAYQGGLHASAQALVAVVLTTTIERGLGYRYPKRLTDARKEWSAEHPDEAALLRFRRAVVLACAARALEEFRHSAESPTFSRHATAHRLDRVQFTKRNALVALTLTTALLRDLHEDPSPDSDWPAT